MRQRWLNTQRRKDGISRRLRSRIARGGRDASESRPSALGPCAGHAAAVPMRVVRCMHASLFLSASRNSGRASFGIAGLGTHGLVPFGYSQRTDIHHAQLTLTSLLICWRRVETFGYALSASQLLLCFQY
jgi:hypothetical protein